MIPSPVFSLARRRFLAALAGGGIACLMSSASVAQDLPPTLANESQTLLPKLSEAIEELSERATELREEKAQDQMEDLVDDLAEEHALDDAAKAALEKAAAEAVKESLEPWREDFVNFISLQMMRMQNRYYDDGSSLLRQLHLEKAKSIVDRLQDVEAVRPESQEVWQTALEKAIGAEAFADWQKTNATRDEERAQSIEKALERHEKRIEKSLVGEITAARDELLEQLDDEKIRKPIEDLAETLSERRTNDWREDTRYVFQRTLEDRWEGFALMANPIPLERDTQWQTNLDLILSPEQMAAWEKSQAEKLKLQEMKLEGILANNETTRRQQFDSMLEEHLSRIESSLELDEEIVETLRAAGEKAVDASMEDWKNSATELFRRLPAPNREAIAKSNRFSFNVEDVTSPTDTEPWQAALEKTLTPAQQASWEAELAMWDDEQAEQLEQMIEATAENYAPQFKANLDPRVADIIATLSLEEKRAEAFRTAAEDAIQQSMDVWKERAREWLDQLSDSQLRNYMQQGHVPLGYNESDAADKQPAWTEAFRNILTPDERQRWEEAQENRERNRLEAIGELAVALVEEWVGIAPDQWETIAALCRKPSERLATQFNEQHYYIGINEFSDVLATVDDKKLAEILDEAQQERWEMATKQILANLNNNRGVINLAGNNAGQPPAKEAIPAGPSPRFVEKAITDLLYQRNQQKHQEYLLICRSEIAVCAKAAGVDEALIPRLETAAKGSIAMVVNRWDSNFSRYVRQRANGANPRTIHQQLAGVGNYHSNAEEPLETNDWQKYLEQVLEPEQLKLWQEASALREERRRRAIGGMVSAFFETRLGLGMEQANKFQEKVAKALKTYGPDIDRMFRSHNSPWFLQYYTIGIGAMGIPDEELKSLLTKDQFDVWEQQFFGNASNYWGNIEQYHESRMKAEKKQNQKK